MISAAYKKNLPGEHIGIVALGKGALQFFQLATAKRCPVAALLAARIMIVIATAGYVMMMLRAMCSMVQGRLVVAVHLSMIVILAILVIIMMIMMSIMLATL